ncbi:MAG: EAL domain-containing protein [Oleiphilaceae bacterium]|nr:EAL domain-containing protein [Oleiphilaceae bacterium]
MSSLHFFGCRPLAGFVALCLCLIAWPAFGDIASIEFNKQDSIGLGARLEYLEDVENNLDLEAVRQRPDKVWTPHRAETPNFGYSDSAYWFRFRLVNTDLKAFDAILAIHYPLLDHIEVYMLEQGQRIVEEVTGDTYPFQQRPLRHREFLFPVTLHWNTPVDVYIKVKTAGSMQLPITLWRADSFSLIDQDEQFVKALYYGMLLLLIVYNLFLFLSIRERPYFYYVGLASSVLVLMAGAHGYMFQYVYPGSPQLQQLMMLLAVPSTMLFASLFAAFFLRLKETAPYLYVTLNVVALMFLFCIVGAFFLPYDTSTRISVFLAIPASLIIMAVGPYAWVKGQTSARYFTVAWFFLLLGIFVGAASKFGFLPRTAFTEYSISWGSTIEALLLSFALADRFNSERSARYKAQREQLKAIDARKQAEQKLYHQATHQPVDGMPNMVLFQQCLHLLLHGDGPRKHAFSIVFIHLERLPEISKTLGHANADIILSLFSRRLNGFDAEGHNLLPIEEDSSRQQHFAHLEGVIYACVAQVSGANDLNALAAVLLEHLSQAVEFNGMELDLGVAIGMASFPEHGRDIATLIRHARVAVDHASKRSHGFALYHDDINPYSARRLTLMGELNKAIQDDALNLYYQPVISPGSGQLIGVEALLRWNHPGLGFIPPDEFISLAEKTGLMRALSHWVLQRSLRDHGDIQGNYFISVNISAVNLQEVDFVARAQKLLAEQHIPAERVVFEVTETAVMQEPEQAIACLEKLAALGAKIAIDDFGTGHSSLAYIRELPVYEVKVDRSFVINMDQNENDQTIVRAAINLCHDLNYKVVAEGVENEAALNMLRDLHCDLAQGYHIARPMPLDDLKVWMQQLANTG